MPYIASTMSADVNYCVYGKTPTGSHEVRRSILILGKANVADKHFITKDGAVTKVSNEELALLKEHPVFKMHEAGGFVKVCASESRAENVKELAKKDASAPKTPGDYEAQGKDVTVTVAEFRTLYPEFADPVKYPDAVLADTLDLATCYISTRNYGALQDKCRKRAIYLLTAHLQTLKDMIAAGKTQVTVTSGASIDKVSVTLAMPPMNSQTQWWFNISAYGSSLLGLLEIKATPGFYVGGSFQRVL